jgi:hypothetical protein
MLLEIRLLKTTRVTNGGSKMKNCLGKAKVYFCRRVCRHTATASMRSRPLVLPFIPDAVGPELGCTIGLVNDILGIWGWDR